MTDLVIQSLEMVAETAGDITPAVYQRYFESCPGSEALMSHIDELVQGKMMVEVYRLVMLEDFSDEAAYLKFEVDNHALAYSVEPHMYGNLLNALMDTVAELLGDQWDHKMAEAWGNRLDELSKEIEARLPEKQKILSL
ncbi:MAG: hemoglobin-like flavoprotein [Candidatus Azotimanducaceae bacterium]|jgi:hemoglobin-like flavoprotein